MANTISLGHRTVTIIPDGATDFDIATVQTNKFRMGTQVLDFTVGEAVSQATSGAAGVVTRWDKRQQVLYLDSMAGTFDTTHVVTGSSSTAHGIPAETQYAFANGIRLSAVDWKPSKAGDALIIREKIATGPVIYTRNDTSGGGVHKSTGGKSYRAYPYIAYADQTFDTPASVAIILEFD